MDSQQYQYSIKLIIRNKIGFAMFAWIFLTTLIFLGSYFPNNRHIYIYSIIFSLMNFIIIFMVILINILKIKKYFINGISVDGIIHKREVINQKIHLGILYPNKFVVFYSYNISGEIYSSSSKILDKKDLAYLKENTKIKVLVNPSNKNDAIILDIYKKI